MFRPRIIPVLLMRNKGLVKTVRFSSPTYIGDPMNAIRIFNEMQSDELIFLDITATCEKRTPDPQLIQKISDEAFMPFAVGGGIHTFEQAKAMIQSGAEKVIFNTAFYHAPDVIKQTVETFGSQSVILSLDIKKTWLGSKRVFVKNASVNTHLTPVEAAIQGEKLGVGEIMIQTVEKDGMMNGYDLALIKEIAESVSIPVIACSGAGNLSDMKKAIEAGASAAAAGSIFVYQGPRRGILINYPSQEELNSLFA